jgi:outer membrane protein assembly factor BamA
MNNLTYMFHPIALTLFICGFVLSVSAQNDGRLVETVDILGSRRIAVEEIRPHIKTQAGDSYNEKRVKDDLQTLLSLGLFDQRKTKFRIEDGKRGGVWVIFEIYELPLIASIEFKEMKFVTSAELISELQAQNVRIERGTVYTPEIQSRIRTVILDYLAKRGYINPQIWITASSASATETEVQFHIVEIPCDDPDGVCSN